MNTNSNQPKDPPNFEALRRSVGLPPCRVTLRHLEYMRAPQAARVLFHAMRLSERPGVVASTLKRETIFWRVSRKGWSTVHWFTVTKYVPELLRLKPFWRVTITLNDEPENLLILPPIDDSLEDKLTLLKANKATLPADIGTADGRQRYWAQLMKELPMFLNLLVNYRIHSGLKSGRFGVKHFHHPELLVSLSEMSPEMRLLGLIDAALEELPHVGQWSGTATELEQMLSETKVGFEARRLLDWNNATGTYLGQLAKKLPHRVQAQHTNAMRRWTIVPSRWVMLDSPVADSKPVLA